MKIEICTGSKCSFYGASFILERLEDFMEERAYMPEVRKDFILDVKVRACQGDCKDEDDIAPLVYVDGERIIKATGPVIMERVMKEALRDR